MTLKTSDGFCVGDVVPESAGLTIVNSFDAGAIRLSARMHWRLAVVGQVSHIDTPALFLNRLSGVEAWRPSVREEVRVERRSRAVRHVVKPIFGPYLFLRLSDDAIPEVLKIRCNDQPVLSRVIAAACGISVIPDAEIDALRSEIQAGAFTPEPKPAHRFKIGDKARVRGGAFDGFDTVIEKIMGDKARVIVNLFGRETPAQMPVSALRVAG